MNNFSPQTLIHLASHVGLTPKYRFYPKTQPFGVIHLAILFQRDERTQLPSVLPGNGLTSGDMDRIKKYYRKGLISPPPNKLVFMVPEINDICSTVRKISYPIYDKHSMRYRLKDTVTHIDKFKKAIGVITTYPPGTLLKRAFRLFMQDKDFERPIKYLPIDLQNRVGC